MNLNDLLSPILKLPNKDERIQSLVMNRDNIIMTTDWGVYQITTSQMALRDSGGDEGVCWVMRRIGTFR